jgi:peptidoglycan/xylan/chitin deacetylase (PgdA/CDA1 family)
MSGNKCQVHNQSRSLTANCTDGTDSNGVKLKRLIKSTTLQMLRVSGAFSGAANSNWRRNRLLVLCYHGIALKDEHQWAGHLYVTPQRLRERFHALKAFGANVLPLGEAFDRLRRRSLPPKTVSITFDDGFHDFLVHAVPLLHEFGYPATLYLTTHYCRFRVPIFNLAVDYLLWKSASPTIDLGILGLEGSRPIQTHGERQAVLRTLLAWSETHQLDTLGKDELARCIAVQVGFDYNELLTSRQLQIMSPNEVSATARAGVDIELHTHRHRTPRDRELFLNEIRDNSTRIREFTGRTPEHFCYPSGDYALEFQPWLRDSGVKTATTCERGLGNPQSDPLRLPRMLDDSNVTALEFQAWLSGLRLR